MTNTNKPSDLNYTAICSAVKRAIRERSPDAHGFQAIADRALEIFVAADPARPFHSRDIQWGYINQDGDVCVNAGGDDNPACSVAPINDGDWHYVTLTRDSGSALTGETALISMARPEVWNNSAIRLSRITFFINTPGFPAHRVVENRSLMAALDQFCAN